MDMMGIFFWFGGNREEKRAVPDADAAFDGFQV
jgi:hypothetical protein